MHTRIARAHRLAGVCVGAVAALCALDAHAADYDIVPTSSTLTLSGHGSVAGRGTIDYDVPFLGSGTGSYETSGNVAFVPSGSDAAVAVGGRLQASRKGGALTVTGASIVPLPGGSFGAGADPWAGSLSGDVSVYDVRLPGSTLALLAPLLGSVAPSSASFATHGVVLGVSGTAPVLAGGTFDTAGLYPSITGQVKLGSVDADWAVRGKPLAAGAGWVGGSKDGTLIVPFELQWHQDLAFVPYAFSDTVDTPVGLPGRFDVQGRDTFSIDWTLSGSLLAVAATPVAEPAAAWLALMGLCCLVGFERARKAVEQSN